MAGQADFMTRPAAQPEADLACDFSMAKHVAEFREQMARGIVPPIKLLTDGVELTFRPESWDAVARYIELESQCCPFLDLAARRAGAAVLLTITGRAEAREFIANIFPAGDN